MLTYSVANGLKRILPGPARTSADHPSDSYDVVIKFYSAKDLPKTDIVGHTDPYFVAKIDHQISFTSTILSNIADPEWKDDEWFIRNIPLDAKLTVKLYDKDDDQLADDYIGRFTIDDLINYSPPLKGHKIIGSFGQSNGRFFLSIRSTPSSEETKQLPRYTYDGPCRYSRHNSVAFGRLTMLNADCVYSTWKIQMRRISVFFPPHQRQHWNIHYKPAKQVFGSCPLSIASRTTLRVAHKTLYGRTLKNNENGRLDSVDDLWKTVFRDTVTYKIKPCVYTYIIDDNTWRFSETGNQLFTDLASKHALLANGSETVRYAGEFHPRPKYGWDRQDDEWELVFDNDSGTYAPDSELLMNLKELLLYNFPGLNVVVYDYKDPALEESMEQLKIAVKRYKNYTPTLNRLLIHYRSTDFDQVDDPMMSS